jgi:hypothetical protein
VEMLPPQARIEAVSAPIARRMGNLLTFIFIFPLVIIFCEYGSVAKRASEARIKPAPGGWF